MRIEAEKPIEYVELGLEDEYKKILYGKGGLLIVGLPGVGKSTLALRIASDHIYERSGERRNKLALIVGIGSPSGEVEVSIARLRVRDEERRVPIIRLPAHGVMKEDDLRNYLAKALNKSTLRKLAEKAGVTKKAKVDPDTFEVIKSFLEELGVKTEKFLDEASKLVPLGWLIATSAILLKYMVEKREKKRIKKADMLVVVDDVEDSTNLAGLISKICRDYNAKVLLVRRVSSEEEYIEYIEGENRAVQWLKDKGLVRDVAGGAEPIVGVAKLLPPPSKYMLVKIVKANTGIELRDKEAEKIYKLSGGIPALATMLAEMVREGRLDLEKLSEEAERGVKSVWSPEHGKIKENLAYYMYTTKKLYETLKEEDLNFPALIAAHSEGLSCDELALFGILSVGIEPDEVFEGEELETVKFYMPRDFKDRGWLTHMRAKRKRRPTKAVRKELAGRISYGASERIAIRVTEKWPKEEWMPEKHTLESVDSWGRVIYRLRDELSFIPPIILKIAEKDEGLRKELMLVFKTLITVLAREGRVVECPTWRIPILASHLASRLVKWGEIEGVEASIAYMLADVIEGLPLIALAEKRVALEIIERTSGEWLAEASDLAIALADVATVEPEFLEKDERWRLLEAIIRMVDIVREKRDWLVASRLSYALALLSETEPLLLVKFLFLALAMWLTIEAGSWGSKLPVAYVTPCIAKILANEGWKGAAVELLEEAEETLKELRGDQETRKRLESIGIRDYESQLKIMKVQIGSLRARLEALEGRYEEAMKENARLARLYKELGLFSHEVEARMNACLARVLVEGIGVLREGSVVEGYWIPAMRDLDEGVVEWKEGRALLNPTLTAGAAAYSHASACIARIALGEDERAERGIIGLHPDTSALYESFKEAIEKAREKVSE